jgi:hypothetical protein
VDSTRNIKDVIKSKYKIESSLIGDGVFGKVFLASFREDSTKKVAIKGMLAISYSQSLQCFEDAVGSLQ